MDTATKYQEINEQVRRGHRYTVGSEVILSTEHLTLWDSVCRKTTPKFVGPFKVVALRGVSIVELKVDPKWTDTHI
jgi:hypothetical protein